jgi:hypothetical protein
MRILDFARTSSLRSNAQSIVGFGLIGAVACAAWAAAIARTWIGRRTTGEVLADLRPRRPAPVSRRSSWIVSVAFAQVIAFGIVFQSVRDGRLLLLAVQVAITLLTLLTYLMYSDLVWLADRGVYFGGRL